VKTASLFRNRSFLRLWLAQVCSQTGDWFHVVALSAVLLRLTGSAEAVGLQLICHYLPASLVSMCNGPYLDRLPRVPVLIASDLSRAALATVFILVHARADLWMVYLTLVLMSCARAFFEPARAALLGTLVKPEELLGAGALTGGTWAVILAVGAGLGGLTAGLLSPFWAFAVDALSFAVSAALISGVKEPARKKVTRNAGSLKEVLRWLKDKPQLALVVSVKGMWSLGTGILIVLTLYGEKLFPLGIDGAFSVGLFYAARGIGAVVGALLGPRLIKGRPGVCQADWIAPAFYLCGIGYAMLSVAGNFKVAVACVILAHIGALIVWMLSTALLQEAVPAEMQGRIFALEFAGLTVAAAFSNALVGLVYDQDGHLRLITACLGLLFFVCGAVFNAIFRSGKRR